MRLSRILRRAETPTDPDAVPLRRALMWALVGLVLAAGLVMYFAYGRLVRPLLA